MYEVLCMSDSAENFIKLLSSYLNNNEIQLYNPDWNEIFEIASIHDLCGILYASINSKKNCANKEIMKKLETMFVSTIRYSTVQEITLQNLIEILCKNKIRHILFKGAVLKNYYPDKELRSMGDIDIVIDSENQKAVHEILIKNGFEFDEVSSHKSVRNYIKNNICFEIHSQIIEKNLFDDIDYISYFNNNFENAVLIKDYTYEFNHEYHFLYIMVHMAKHFKFSGCGVRMLLDIAAFVKHLSYVLRWDVIEKELSVLCLEKFSANIFELCRKWFNVTIPILDFKADETEINIIGDYIIDGGVFGYNGKNVDALRFAENNKLFAGKLKNILKMIFPSYEHLKSRYVWFENVPKYLLPIGWFRFWWLHVVKNRENGIERIKNAFQNNEDAYIHNKLLSIAGLNRKKD